MRLVDIESESFLNEMREKQNACKEMIQSSDGETPTWTERDHWEGVYGIFVEMALTLKKQPTVDAAHVVHARWKNGHCSCCGEDVAGVLDTWTNVQNLLYCPNCGAKMDLEEQDA